MPNPGDCSICEDPRALDINEALIIERRSLRATACQFNVGREALRRHRNHAPELLVQASRNLKLQQQETLIHRLEEITTETRAILREAREADEPDNRLALMAIQRLERQLEFEAELLEVIKRQPIINVLIAPALEQALGEILYDYPEVHQDVVRAIDRVRLEIDA